MSDTILEELVAIAGRDNASNDPAVLETFSRDQSFVPARRPDYAVSPATVEQVQEIVRLANRRLLPVIPLSSGTNFHGGCVPVTGGVLVDLRRMDRVITIDERNWNALVEPGVTYGKLQPELAKRSLRVAAPLTSPPSASVLADYMDRAPLVTAADFIFGNELFNTFDIVMPTGELFTVGHPPTSKAPSMAPDGPALDFYRLFQGAQGTLGIVVRISIRLLPLPAEQGVVFIPADSVARAVEVMREIGRKELGLECFALNSFNMAALLVEEPAKKEALKAGDYVGIDGAEPWGRRVLPRFHRVRADLPPWTVVLCLTGWGRRAGEKVAYQRLDLKDLAADAGFELQPTVGGIPGLDRVIREEVMLPSRMQTRFGYRGTCHGLMFHARPDRLPEIEAAIGRVAARYGYPTADIGGCLLSIERGRTVYAEFDFHCDRRDTSESGRVKDLFQKASEAVVEAGGFFDRPYGVWADIMYRRAGTYTEYLKKLKRQLDLNNVMNPGKLCF